jgi:hypothetical protein
LSIRPPPLRGLRRLHPQRIPSPQAEDAWTLRSGLDRSLRLFGEADAIAYSPERNAEHFGKRPERLCPFHS